MDLSVLVKKYHITDQQIDIIMSCMMEDADLSETISKASLNLNHEQVFAIASFLSKSFFGDSIEVAAPAMLHERMSIQEQNSESNKEKIEQTKEIKRLKAIEEDLLLFYAERIAVSA